MIDEEKRHAPPPIGPAPNLKSGMAGVLNSHWT